MQIDRTLGAVYGFFGGGLVAMIATFVSGADFDERTLEMMCGRTAIICGVLGYVAGRLSEPRNRP